MSSLIEITTEEEWQKHIESLPPSTLQIISFHAPWAAPCAQMSVVLRTLALSYPATTPPTTSWVSINAEEVISVSDAFDVTAVPFLVLTRNNAVLETVSGSDAAKVRSTIEKHANSTSSTNGTSLRPVPSISHTSPEPSTPPTTSTESQEPTSKEDLHERLSNLVKAAPVMLFMKGTPSAPQCGFSRQLVALLRENSVKYGFFNILADDEVRQGLKEFADWPTFPQLWMDGELVGGLDIVKEEAGNDPDFFKAYSVAKPATAA
ncbi:hypothetical protein SS1G_07640 [Sclerotinia sclerotiorum 1980 UF-70]|uniref:Uncharacterized protein n=2 Tax=Sclerotinia sclerotiorum (strain ATCC 18683 / 1980 / Ss-1) TaxID=665079 RepID=A7EQN8_SCLS1|nr:hypothetical protein SS1G_07640 [Sclerotinia sclerotiorum 1980 UF-70]APA13685.1 hypothetical protein sscle_11g084550 [Sclerotinia sclerotiorum 1980 UF-70]EDN91780.1 hypothetical protein SS1G_07640 [Sclerotinia sclerotiorum 1980 UF-70]